MRKYIILFFIFYWNVTYAQSDYKQDYAVYQATYNYIINDYINKGNSINIFDSLTGLNVAVFWRELKKTAENENVLFSRLYNIYQNVNFTQDLSLLINSNSKKNPIV